MGERKIDTYQKAAIDSKINTVVSAGAGSGKTTVLSERFTDLILNRGCNVDEILTLTFTKKATVEMSTRIYKVLKEKVKDQADNFYKANIRTLDSYCNSIAKMGAHYFGISPDYTQDDDLIKQKVTALALPFILEHKNNDAIKKLVDTKNYQKTTTELFVNSILYNSTIVSELDFEADFNRQKEAVINEWNKSIKKIEEILRTLINTFNELPEKKQSKAAAWYIITKKNCEEIIPSITYPFIDDSSFENTEKINELKNFINILIQINIKVPDKRSFPIGNELIFELRNYAHDSTKVPNTLISLYNFISCHDVIKSLLPLFTEFQNKINNLKRSLNILTFADISDIARKTLENYPEIRLIEKKKYKAIMIDEFQDNNQMQKDLLFMLAEKEERMEKGVPSVDELYPDKLFFVGDEKQSIYKFRGADVSVFRKLSDDFKDGNLQMTNNYRSHPALIASFNTIFGGIEYPPSTNHFEELKPSLNSVFFNDSQDKTLIPNYEAIYKNVTLSDSVIEEIKNEPAEKLYAPHIHIARYSKETDNDSEENIIEKNIESEWIANKIQELTTTGVNGKKFEYSDIAILYKTYNNQEELERVLLNHSIPYNTEQICGLYSDGPVNDIFSFIRLCVFENDILTYSQVLCSPFVNLSYQEANAIVLKNELPFTTDAENILSKTSLKRYNDAKLLFEEIKEDCQTLPITQIITKLWYEQGYRYETMLNTKVQMYSKMYDLIFELANQYEQKNIPLASFLDDIKKYQTEKLDNMDIPLEQPNGVHLLTIHKSKGLEFKVVFIFDSEHGLQNETNTQPVYSSKEFGLSPNIYPPEFKNICNKNFFFTKAKEENQKMEIAELRRVTYVALTRAIDELYITNSKYKPSKDCISKLPGENGKANSIYEVLEPVLNHFETEENIKNSPFEFIEIKPAVSSNIKNNESNIISEKENFYNNITIITKETVESKYKNPSQLHKTDDESYSNKEFLLVNDAPYSEITQIVNSSIPKNSNNAEPRFTFANFGTIAHAYMEAAINKNDVKYSNRETVGLENNKKNLEILTGICEKMQNEFINSSLGQKAINSTWHKAEYEFKSRIENKIIKGTIDLIFKNQDDSYTIVDYKTNQTIEPEIYYAQLKCYRQAASQILNVDESKIDCYLYYLRFSKEVNITDECNKINLKELIFNVDTE